MSDSQVVAVQYNIPRYMIGRPGSQFRASTGEMRITPGIWEPFEFHYNNSDGVSLNLAGFKLRIIFYFPQGEYETLAANLQTNEVLVKDMAVSDPYSGVATLMLSDQETLTLARSGRSTLRWAVYFINEQAQVFAAQITSEGARYGLAHIDRSEIPIAETVKAPSISK